MGEETDGRFAQLMARVRRNRRAPLMIVLPTVAALGAGAAVAIGSIPSSTGTYTGCYNTVPLDGTSTSPSSAPGFNGQDFNGTVPYGQLRLIDPSDTTATIPGETTPTPATDVYQCYANETTATWNQQGLQGLQGLQGPPGTSGRSGANGASGANGGWQSDTSYGIDASGGTRLYLKISGVTGKTSAPITTIGGWNRITNKKETTRHSALARTASKGSGGKGFKGKTQTENGLIELKTFSLGSATPTTNLGSQSSGAGAGKVNIQTFSFVKSVDKTSPLLYKDLTESTVIPKAEVIAVHANNGKQEQVAEFAFSDLIIKSLSQKGSIETVTAVVRAIQTQLGSGKSSIVTGWNRVQNTADEATPIPGG